MSPAENTILACTNNLCLVSILYSKLFKKKHNSYILRVLAKLERDETHVASDVIGQTLSVFNHLTYSTRPPA
jgi:hypothetical protein